MNVVPTSGIIRPIPAVWSQESSKYMAIPFGRVLHVYDVSENPPKRLTTTSEPHQQNITCALSVPGMQYVTASHDATLRFWDAMDGQCLRTVDTIRPVSTICHAPNALLVLTDESLLHYSLSSTKYSTTSTTTSELSTSKEHKQNQTIAPCIRTLFKLDLDPFVKMASSSDMSITAVIRGKQMLLFSLTSNVDPNNNNNNTSNFKSIPLITTKFKHKLSAVAISSSSRHLAVSDTEGKIYYFSDPSQLLRSAPHVQSQNGIPDFSSISTAHKHRLSDSLPSVFHWHSSAVQALLFTRDDSCLLSGGQESVLCVMTLRNHNFGMSKKIPRTGAPIIALSVSPDESLYSISHSDNSVSLLDHASMEFQSNIRSIACRLQIAEDGEPLVDLYNTLTGSKHIATCGNLNDLGHIIIANDNTRIQQFDALRGEHIQNFDIVPINEIYGTPSKRPDGTKLIMHSESVAKVTNVAIHPSGNLMATVDFVDRSVEHSSTAESCTSRVQTVTTLRVWEKRSYPKSDERQRVEGRNFSWILSAVIINPHGDDKRILSVTFHPTMRLLLTTGTDRQFKFWRATKVNIENGNNNSGINNKFSWRCELVSRYRDELCRCASFSSDGSMLAMGCGSVVALWEIKDLTSYLVSDVNDSNLIGYEEGCSIGLEFYQGMVHAPVGDIIENLQFVMCDIPVFIAVTTTAVYAWNALTHSIWWSFAAKCIPSTLTIDMETGRFAVAVEVASLVGGEESEITEGKNATPLKRRSTRKEDHNEDENDVMEMIDENEGNDEKNSYEHTNGFMDEDMAEDEQWDSNVENRRSGNNRNGNQKSNPTDVRNRWNGENVVDPVESKKKTMNVAVVIFDANSPVPIRVHRLPKGSSVCALTFVRTGGKESSQKNVVDGHSSSALVCIDDGLEVSLMRSNGDGTNEFSMTSDEPLANGLGDENVVMNGTSMIGETDGHNTGKLGMLLGDSWLEEAKAIASTAYVKPNEEGAEIIDGEKAIQRAFENHFIGAIHAQAPVNVQSFGFMKSLLDNDANSDNILISDPEDKHVSTEDGQVHHDAILDLETLTEIHPGNSQTPDRLNQSTKENDEEGMGSLNRANGQKGMGPFEMLQFCRELLKSQQSPRPTKNESPSRKNGNKRNSNIEKPSTPKKEGNVTKEQTKQETKEHTPTPKTRRRKSLDRKRDTPTTKDKEKVRSQSIGASRRKLRVSRTSPSPRRSSSSKSIKQRRNSLQLK